MANQIGFLEYADQMESSDQKPELLLRWKKFILGLDNRYRDLLKELLSFHDGIFASAEEVINRAKEAIEDLVLPSEEDVAEGNLLRLKQDWTKLKVVEGASPFPCSSLSLLFLFMYGTLLEMMVFWFLAFTSVLSLHCQCYVHYIL